MALSPRKRGQAAVRARHSAFTRTIFTRLEPFFAVEEVSGGPLLIATVIALVWANSPFADSYQAIWGTRLGVTLANWTFDQSLATWARDALLPVFFFGVGMEVKRELVKGLLSSRQTALLPIACALGGMIVPVILYLLLNSGTQAARGWGVVVTTDTAFALALLGIFASNLPRSVRVLLLAFAAVDDIGGLLVIAFVYTSSVSWAYLGAAAALILVIHVLRRFEIIASIPYVLLGIAVLLLVQASGVHVTIAGVILGALVPVYPRVPESHFAQVVQHQVDGFQRAHQSATGATDPERRQNAVDKQEAQLGQLSETAHATYETAQRITHAINPWISYVVLPLFALSNAGVVLSHEVIHGAMSNTLALGVIAGLLLGKPVGVLAFAFAAVRTGLAKIPEGVTWPMLSAVSVSSGIGFTISLFISDLAYANRQMADEAKVGVLCASVLASVAGYVMFRWAVSRQEGLQSPPEGSGEGESAEPPRDGAQEEIHAGPLEGASGTVRNIAREDAGKRKK